HPGHSARRPGPGPRPLHPRRMAWFRGPARPRSGPLRHPGRITGDAMRRHLVGGAGWSGAGLRRRCLAPADLAGRAPIGAHTVNERFPPLPSQNRMHRPQSARSAPVELPRALIDRIASPFVRFLHIEAAGGAVLLVFTIAALLLSNSPWADAFFGIWETRIELRLGDLEFGRSLKGWINDGLMTLFFFLVALELKREAVLGELRSPRMAALSIAAALGGMVAPAAVCLARQWAQPGQHGWGIVMATDTAFVIACLALLGKRIPHSLRVFMLFLAIVDDIGAILVVAIGYSHHMDWRMLALAGLCIGILR